MVSLSPTSTISTGARFLTDMSTNDDENEELVNPERLSFFRVTTLHDFTSLKTNPVVSLHLLISTAISITGIVLAVIWKEEKRCEAYFIMLFCRAAFWIVTFAVHLIIKYYHRKIRMDGYHEFHRLTKNHKDLPLYVVSFTNTVVIVVQTLLHNLYGPHFAENCIIGAVSPVIYIAGLSTVETFTLLTVETLYMIKVCNFNRLEAPPDAYTERPSEGSVGFIAPNANHTELLEAQADLISYYKEQNSELNIKLRQCATIIQSQNDILGRLVNEPS